MSGWKPIKISFDVTIPSTELEENLPPILLLHGMTQSKEYWEGIEKPLADATHRKVYRLDARNHGDSEWTDDHNYRILAKDVEYFMEQNKISKAVLVGHSMGGKTAMHFVGDYPEKVEKLVVEDMTPKRLEGPVVQFIRGFVELLFTSLEQIPKDADLKKAKENVREFLLSQVPPEMATERTRDVLDLAWSLKETDEGFQWKTNIKTIKRELDEILVKQDIPTYTGDILFIYGSVSVYKIEDDKDFILEMFPKATFKAIEGATHVVHQEYPKEYAEAVAEFINRS